MLSHEAAHSESRSAHTEPRSIPEVTHTRSPQRAASLLADLWLIALSVVFGLQILRLLLTDLGVYLQQVKGAPSWIVGAIVVGVFLSGFLVLPILRLRGAHRVFLVAATGLGLTRLVEQMVVAVPVDLVLAMLGTTLFLWFLPLCFGGTSGARAPLGLLLGIATDTAIKGLFATVDLSWLEGMVPLSVVGALVVIQWSLLWRVRAPPGRGDRGGPAAVSLLGVGPALILELLVFQNIGLQTVLTGWSQPRVLVWLVLCNAVGLVAAAALAERARRLPWSVHLALGVPLVWIVSAEPTAVMAAFTVLAGQLIVALSLMSSALIATNESDAARRAAVGSSAGMVLFVVLLFLFYASYDLNLVLPRTAVAPLAAAVLVLSAARAGAVSRVQEVTFPAAKLVLISSAPLLILALVRVVGWHEARADQGGGWPVRVMTYNVRQGFDSEGRLALEAQARVIATAGAGVVALQEVSRGWVINGSVDQLAWLSERLGLPFVWGPTAGPVWGNAILSRYPIKRVEKHAMPNSDSLLIGRGYLIVEIDPGDGAVLRVIATHLHAGRGQSAERLPQAEALVRSWGGSHRTVILGDLNATPADPELALLSDAGLRDAFSTVQFSGPGYTAPAIDPRRRIDYVLVSPDLRVTDLSIPGTIASDHLPVALTVGR